MMARLKQTASWQAFLWPETLIWLVLMALFLSSWWVAYVPIGIWKTIASLTISVIKTLLVATFFMHLVRSESLIRLASSGGLIWLAILFTLSWADYLTR
jgi:cytochrome c oxidase subunit 4